MGEFVKIEIRPLLTKIDAKSSFCVIKIKSGPRASEVGTYDK